MRLPCSSRCQMNEIGLKLCGNNFIHVPDFDCDGDGSSDSPDQELPTGPELDSSDFGRSTYQSPSLFNNRMVPKHVLPISFQHSLVHLKTKNEMLGKGNDTAEQPGLDWQMEEDRIKDY